MFSFRRMCSLVVAAVVVLVAGCEPDTLGGSDASGADTSAADGTADAVDTASPETGRDTTASEDSGAEGDGDAGDEADTVETADSGKADAADTSDATSMDTAPPPGDYYLAPSGSDSNPGTKAEPFGTLEKLVSAASPGDLLYVRGGTYKPDEPLGIQKDGEEDNRIELRAYPGEDPVFDYAESSGGNGDHAVLFRGAKWWHVEGLHIKNAPAGAFYIGGKSRGITLENCEASYCGRNAEWGATGFAIRGQSRDILIENCDAHHNANLKGDKYENADGFAAGNPDTEEPDVRNLEFRGCRAWNNADDGIDLFFATEPVVIENMWAWENGLDDDNGSISGQANQELGNGNGFKLGGEDDGRDTGPADHEVRRCVAVNNRRRGFNENNNGGAIEVTHNTSFGNSTRGYRFHKGEDSILRNNLSFQDSSGHNLSAADSESNSWDDGTGVTVDESDFQSLDASQLGRPRQPDGSLPEISFLHLAEGSDLVDAGTDVGGDFNGEAPDLGAFER